MLARKVIVTALNVTQKTSVKHSVPNAVYRFCAMTAYPLNVSAVRFGAKSMVNLAKTMSTVSNIRDSCKGVYQYLTYCSQEGNICNIVY